MTPFSSLFAEEEDPIPRRNVSDSRTNASRSGARRMTAMPPTSAILVGDRLDATDAGSEILLRT